jgi:hypothetical protein
VAVARKRATGDAAGSDGFAVRARFRNPRLFTQFPLLSEDAFRDLAKDCGVDVPRSLLRWYVENGFLTPIRRERGAPRFTRWQLWTLWELESVRAQAVRVSDYASLERQDRRSWREQLEQSAILTRGHWFQQWLELVILLQNGFGPAARGSRGGAIRRVADDEIREQRYLRGTYARRVAGAKPLAEVGLSRKVALELRQTASMRIDRLDPVAAWYPILRAANESARQKLRGVARLAQELYVADRIIELYLERLTGRVQPDPAYAHASRGVDWVRRAYGRSKDYNDPRFLELMLTEFGLSTAQRGVVFAEGKTEVEMVKAVARDIFGFSLSRLGIDVRDLLGIGNVGRAIDLMRFLSEPRVSRTVRAGGKRYLHLERPLTFVYLVADREGPFAGPWRGQKPKLERELRRTLGSQFVMLFNPDFERANFSPRELALTLTRALGRPIAHQDVAAWRKQRGPQKQELNAWLEQHYGRRVRKPELVALYVRLARKDSIRDDATFRRPILAFVDRILKIRLRQVRVRRARLRRYITSMP